MKKLWCIGLLFLVIAGCKSKIPGDIIQPDKMGAVLYDIHITDGYVGSIPRQDSAKKVGAAYYKGIYKKFKIDSMSYTRSMNYYFANPDLLSKIYEGVTKNLKTSKDSLDKINAKKVKLDAAKKAKENKKTQDSLNKIKAKVSNPAMQQTAKRDSLKKVRAAKMGRGTKTQIEVN